MDIDLAELSETLINTPLQRIGINLRKPAKTCFNCLQPEGLTESSRWSRGKRGATPAIRRAGRQHPVRSSRTVPPVLGDVCFWHPSGVQQAHGQFPVVVPPLPRTTTGYHLSTLRVGAAGSLVSRRF